MLLANSERRRNLQESPARNDSVYLDFYTNKIKPDHILKNTDVISEVHGEARGT